MAPLSSSVSTLKPTNLNSTPREFHHFKTPNRPRQLPPPASPHCSLSFSTTKTTTFSALFTHKNLTSLASQPLTSSPHIHRKPATGYAAALLDIAQRNGSLDSVQQDVQKFSKLFRNSQIQALINDPFLGYKEKGKAVKELARKGKFNKHLVNLLKMLIEKNKLEMVSEVLDDFERIYDELIDTKLVWISSEKMIGENRLFEIAKRIQELSGAVKVKIKNLVADKLPKTSNSGLVYD
ncbi:putative 14-3-3 protein [Hibiscus syriacus]|uniref:14-3-3 protein n=1 Tax=Hibiscus syriacus TaxID=106335 RepID=A0A6A3AJ60_HIBSY|nr:ATP synthase subunit delta, chloroplastic-like [Hibiscus syriacus]KAE8703637.1 putative 14-3-3 protein [Hibiscus syriacus]